MSLSLIDHRERALEDGCAENITILLATQLDYARKVGQELHVVSLDVPKAFDSVSH